MHFQSTSAYFLVLRFRAEDGATGLSAGSEADLTVVAVVGVVGRCVFGSGFFEGDSRCSKFITTEARLPDIMNSNHRGTMTAAL
jgi:hypothetical protein